MAQESGLIHFRCTALSHQRGAEGRAADTLTVHEGRWSYCPLDIRADDHAWEATGGVRIEMLRRGSPVINLDLDVRPQPPKAPAGAAGRGVEPRPTPPGRKRPTKG